MGDTEKFEHFAIKRHPDGSLWELGGVSLTSKPEGATVKINGIEVGQTPVNAYALSKGKYVLELSAAGYQSRSIDLEINQGSLNNLGLILLVRETGRLSLKSDPANLSIEVVNSEQKSSFGTTPITLDNLPTGDYTVRIKRSGWPDYVQKVTVQPNALATVEQTFKGISVALKSDPTGATIYVGPTKAAAAIRPRPGQSSGEASDLGQTTRQSHQRSASTYRSKEDYERAREAAYDRFDAEWDARKNALKREKEYYEYQIDHSDNAAKQRWKMKKEEVERYQDQLDDQKDAAKHVLKRQWNDD